MRGKPNNPVACISCGELKGAPRDLLCHSCRIKARPNPNKRFLWTPALDQQLRIAYQGARTRRALTDNLDALQRRIGFTRAVVLARAAQFGLSSPTKRWTAEEIETLNDLAGTQSKSAIARKLGRSYWSVKAQCSKQNISARIASGYSRNDVEYLLGVSSRSVRKWLKLGWLKVQEDRITETSMARFLREHPEEYTLSRVDESWFKGLLFPSFGRNYMPVSQTSRYKQASAETAA